MEQIVVTTNTLIKDISTLIDQTKAKVALKANSEMTILYWHIGQKITQEILKNTRAEYGQEIIKSFMYGRGFTRTALIRMTQFYEAFSNQEIGATLSRQLSCRDIIKIIKEKNEQYRK